ncbi:MAG: hypothetical protein HY695_37995 [Deltaproteobacteria bacterium]|nr:hypothetical protein [Deltaproteobacteria bacterium]
MNFKNGTGRLVKVFVGAWLLYFLLPQSTAIGQAPYYQGKTITLVRGSTPGGIGEMRLRALVPYLKKHLPGQPTIVIEFMPGAGGRKVANYIAGSARSDGHTIGSTPGGMIASAILGETGVKYDLEKLIFLGSTESAAHYSFLTRREAGWDTVEKVQNAEGMRIGAHAVGHPIYITGRTFAYLLGLKGPKFVTGYSSPEQDLALARGEIDARSETSASILQRHPEWIEKKMMHFHTVIEIPKGTKIPGFPHLPDLEKFARSQKERQLLSMFRSLRAAGSPYFISPEVPKEHVRILQAAFRKAYDDPEFHKEYKKLTGADPSPITPEEHQKVIREIPREREIVELYTRLSGGDPLPPR